MKLKKLNRIGYKQNSKYCLDNISHLLLKTAASGIILSRSYLSTLPEEIPYNPDVTSLSLNYNTISRIPDSISCLVNLQKIDLSQNKISEIADGLFSLKELA